MKTARNKDNEIRITVRFPAELIEQLRTLAPEHDRSLNSEIVTGIRTYLASQKKGKRDEVL